MVTTEARIETRRDIPMMRRTFARLTAAVLVLLGTLLGPGSLLSPSEVKAQAMSDYTAYPPFINQVTPPNILFFADMTSTMKLREYDGIAFASTTIFYGLFDHMKCYTYDSGDGRFEPSATKNPFAVGTRCDTMAGGSTSYWDGNFLNWAALRRADAAKKAMTGGSCVGLNPPRDADGNCKFSGSPALPTITHQTLFTGSSDNDHTTGAIPSATAAGRVGLASPPANLYFHLRGSGSLAGWLCMDDDATAPSSGASSCSDADAFSEGQLQLRVALESAPRGVLQDFSGRARFGLMQFGGAASTDIEILVPIGARQARDYTGTIIETFTTNTAAMVDAVDELFHKGQTPLAEAIYEAIRYFAQLPSAYNSTSFVFPLAFSPAVALGVNGVGSMGNGSGGSPAIPEESVLTGTETCPAGYIANACGRDPYFFGSNHSPAWASPSAVATCCKSYVILFSDGRADMNVDLPANAQGLKEIAAYHPYHGTHCTSSNTADPPSPITTCSQATTLDGAEILSQHKADRNLGHWMDELAYWAHTTDLRQATIPVINEAGHDLPGFQNLTFYAFQAAGDPIGRDFLMHLAVAGAFEDMNGNNLPDNGLSGASAAPCNMTDLTTPCEWDKFNNATGAAGRDNIPDAFFKSQNVEEMAEKLTATLNAILQRSSSGTAASVLASSTTGEGSIYQAFYYPTTTEGFNSIKWTGYLQGLFVDAFGNSREDTDQDGKLIYQNDKIVVTRYDSAIGEVVVDKYADSNGDGKADSATCSPCGQKLKDLLPLWEAGKQLALKDSSSRKILTWVDSNDDDLVNSGEQISFDTTNSATLSPYLRAGAAPYTADNIINFIRGDQITGLRDRQLTVSGAPKVWKLGDIVHSTPTIVGPPKERHDVIYGDSTYTAFFTKYKDRRTVTYVGANDGMLHAINAGFYHRGDDPSTGSAVEHGWFTRTPTDNASGPKLGDELWGFIPYQLLPQLQWLTRSDYTHVFYVDMRPKVTDARIFTPDADHPEGWGTILIGGFRLGGSCKDCPGGNGKEMKVNISGTDRYFYSAYFVLDITNPEVDPKLLWSFTDETLGLTTSYPTVVRVNPLADAKTSNANAKWFVVFGSGPTGYEGASSTKGQVYTVDLKLGPGTDNSNVTTDSTNSNKSFIGDLISLDANLDYRADVTYFGSVADTGGTPKWEGVLFRMTTSANGAAPFGGSTTPSAWGQANKPTRVLSDFSCTPSPGCSGTMKPGPMAAAPTVTMDQSSNIWVFIGTGRMFHLSDQGLAETQYFFGVKDDAMTGTCPQGSETDCQQKDLVNVSATVVCSTCTGGTNQVTDPNNTGVTTLTGSSTSSLQGLVASRDGWFTTLPAAKERTLVSPTLIGGIVFFPSYIPGGDVCASGTGTSSLYALFYLTGSAYKVSVVGTETVGGNTNVKRSTTLGIGAASQVGIHIGAQGTDAGTGVTSRVKACNQLSTGALTCIQAQPVLGTWSRFVSWINLRL